MNAPLNHRAYASILSEPDARTMSWACASCGPRRCTFGRPFRSGSVKLECKACGDFYEIADPEASRKALAYLIAENLF